MTTLPEPFDVCVAWVEFPDHPGVGKARPVIALSGDSTTLQVVAVKVTSHPPRPEFPGEVPLQDWRVEGLNVPSTARCTQVASLALDCISKVIGSLTDGDVEAVLNGLAEAGMLAE